MEGNYFFYFDSTGSFGLDPRPIVQDRNNSVQGGYSLNLDEAV